MTISLPFREGEKSMSGSTGFYGGGFALIVVLFILLIIIGASWL
jgi:uncharacterized protein (TIGR01732 family)